MCVSISLHALRTYLAWSLLAFPVREQKEKSEMKKENRTGRKGRARPPKASATTVSHPHPHPKTACAKGRSQPAGSYGKTGRRRLAAGEGAKKCARDGLLCPCSRGRSGERLGTPLVLVGRWSRSHGKVLYPGLQGEQQEVEELSLLQQNFLEACAQRIVKSRAPRKLLGRMWPSILSHTEP